VLQQTGHANDGFRSIQMPFDATTLAGFASAAPETYRRAECAVFRKTAETWGEYSNMAGGFPAVVNGTRILTSEALYQACRFPHLPNVQREIIDQASPMAAKMKGKPHRKNSRPDFDELRVPIMWWALRVKLACNYGGFARILMASKDRTIVEDSHKDTFWGAKAVAGDYSTLVGHNVLGRLLVALREIARERSAEEVVSVEPPDIKDFLLYGRPISRVVGRAEPLSGPVN
jgi:type I restriction enzyme S subunit